MRLVQLSILIALVSTLPIIQAYSGPLPGLSQRFEAKSALSYMNLERQFVEQYLFDNVYGGTYLSVDGAGNVLNSTKDIIFQTNVILFLAGMNAQSPDPRVKFYVASAANWIVNHLAWGPDGPGTWDAWSNRNGSVVHRMDWLSHSEAYVSWGLLWAYRITGNSTYLQYAKTNLNYQLVGFPDGHILFSPGGGPGASDLTKRSPERMSYYSMYQLTGNRTYLDFAQKVQAAEEALNGWDPVAGVNQTTLSAGPHATAIVDEAFYALVTGNQAALNESQQLFAWYESDPLHDSRDDLQNFLMLDFAFWTMTHDVSFRYDALRTYKRLLQFWDPSSPYGFWADTTRTTKTCFSRGYPILDLTPPLIVADPSGQTVTATINDPPFTALDMTFNGIGVNPASVYLFYSVGGGPWSNGTLMTQTGTDTFVTTVPQNIASQNPAYLVSASDYFNNTSTLQFTKVYTGTPVSQQTTTQFTSTQTVTSPSGPLVATPTTGSSFPVWLLVIAGGLLALILIAFLFFRRPQDLAPLAYWRTKAAPLPPAATGVERNLYCACPYWIECARVHSQCPTCTSLRQYGACCACYIMPPDSCKHPSGLGPVYGPYVNYGPPQYYHQPPKGDNPQT